MRKAALILLGLMLVMLGVGFYGLRTNKTARAQRPLIVYCSAASRAVLDEIIQRYQQEYRRDVQVEYGPSQTLLSRLEIAGQGDLFIPADNSFLDLGVSKNLIAERLPIATMRVVLAVAKGNPKAIHSWQDLVNGQVRLVQADPDGSAIGKRVRDHFSKSDRWTTLQQATVAFRGTVTDVANDVQLGAVDAGIVYDAVLSTHKDLEIVSLTELDAISSQVEVGVLKSAPDSEAALHFARYITARDRGLENFQQHGFQITYGDLWADQPQLKLFAGSMLRPAIEDTIKRFQEREGVQVSTVYNGCGILVGQMKTGQHPDAYFACDVEFMKQVVDLFPKPVDVSQNELVILVAKGNPKGIQSLKDLTTPGLRVGVGHEKQCAMGWITQVTFREGGVQNEVMKNVTVQAPTGDMLVNQMRAGSLDAAVVYLSNAAGAADQLDALQIQGLPCSIAVQPWAVYKDSNYPHLANRLFQAIVSPVGKSDFESEGFGWKLQQE